MTIYSHFVNLRFILYTYNKRQTKIIVGSKNPDKEIGKKDLVAIIQDLDCRENDITPSSEYRAQKDLIEAFDKSEIKIGKYTIKLFTDNLPKSEESIPFLEARYHNKQKNKIPLTKVFSNLITKLLRYRIIN